MGVTLGSEKPNAFFGGSLITGVTKISDPEAEKVSGTTFSKISIPTGGENPQVDPDELIFQTWAFCKAKKLPPRLGSEKPEDRFSWRGRKSFQRLDCGEDSFFTAAHNKAMGVADGVGGWRRSGVDPSEFSNALMQHAKTYTDEHGAEKYLDPQKIMQVAHEMVLKEKKVKAGSSTACIATLRKAPDGSHELDIANLGDSGLIVVRDHETVFRAEERTHGFNTPYQLGVIPPEKAHRNINDKASQAAREKVKVKEGDVIVVGTDGLFDNYFTQNIAREAGWVSYVNPSDAVAKHKNADSSGSMHSSLSQKLSGWFKSNISNEFLALDDPYRIAERIVMNAWKEAKNDSARTPWSVELEQIGRQNARGGKPDDITILLARVGKRGTNDSSVPDW